MVEVRFFVTSGPTLFERNYKTVYLAFNQENLVAHIIQLIK
jgi:hypothetical protein